jgi:tetratricopeptide (TPR) repeat protein
MIAMHSSTMPDTARCAGRAAARLALIGTVAVMLSACGGMNRSDRPAQVEDRGAVPAPPAATGSDTQIAAYTPPAQPAYARPEPKRAVAVLQQRAEDQRRSGDLDGATVSLERALRIAPDDALLWHALAEVRMTQQRHELVVQLAAKSNALANPADRELRGSNWHLIAQARRALGDVGGAREAERRAASYN